MVNGVPTRGADLHGVVVGNTSISLRVVSGVPVFSAVDNTTVLTGVDFEKVDHGLHHYSINGKKVSRSVAFAAVEATGDGESGLSDDSNKSHLTVVIPVGGIDGQAQRQKLLKEILTHPTFAKYADRVHLQVYTSDSPFAKRVKAAVTLQDPAPKGGKVVATTDELSLDAILNLLAAIDGVIKKPVVPVKPDPNVPAPTPSPAPSPDGKIILPEWLVAVLGTILALLGYKSITTKKEESK